MRQLKRSAVEAERLLVRVVVEPALEQAFTKTSELEVLADCLPQLEQNEREVVVRAWNVEGALKRSPWRREQLVRARSPYAYDELDRLTEVRDQADALLKEYSYDSIGNIAYESDVGDYEYGVRPHAVTGVEGLTLEYDDVGNNVRRTSDDGAVVSVDYNKWNLPKRFASQPAGGGDEVAWRYAYDADGARVSKKSKDGEETVERIGGSTERITRAGVTHERHGIFVNDRRVAELRLESCDRSNRPRTDAEKTLDDIARFFRVTTSPRYRDQNVTEASKDRRAEHYQLVTRDSKGDPRLGPIQVAQPNQRLAPIPRTVGLVMMVHSHFEFLDPADPTSEWSFRSKTSRSRDRVKRRHLRGWPRLFHEILRPAHQRHSDL